MRNFINLMVASALLAGCNADPTGKGRDAAEAPSEAAPGRGDEGYGMAANDPAPGSTPAVDLPDAVERPDMQLQVVLDRLGFTPGVVDGKPGASTRNAILGFQEANGLQVTGTLDEPTRAALGKWSNIPATRVVTIPADFAAGPFAPLPKNPAEQAKLPEMGYASLDEKLAERFHTTIETLAMLNPGGLPAGSPEAVPTASASATTAPATTAAPALFRAGQAIRVPNVGADAIRAGSVTDEGWARTLASLGVGSEQPKAARIVVSKSKGTLRAYDEAGMLVGMYTATMGSRRDPLPLGTWKILGIAHNPPFHYNPELFWDVSDSVDKQKLPPGPNGPVGVVWIDLSKEHYGIHGTPEPQTIGRAQSHGCVRLTNWDAARLAQMVSTRTQVLFEA